MANRVRIFTPANHSITAKKNAITRKEPISPDKTMITPGTTTSMMM